MLEGRLTGIDEDSRLMVERFIHGGRMTLTVGESEIEEFEVRNR